MAMAGDWVDAIFTKLSLVYGVRFKAQYGSMTPDQIRSDWAHELEGISPEAVNYALHNLPTDHPPNVLQFRALCITPRPQPMRAMIPTKGARMTEKVRQQLRRVTQGHTTSPLDPLAGARSLRDKERNGILLTKAQREFWRQALRHELMREQYAREEREREESSK